MPRSMELFFFQLFIIPRILPCARAVPGLSLNRSRKRARPRSYDGALVLVCLWPYGIVWVIGYPLPDGKTNKTAVQVLSTPLAFPKRTDNGSAKRSGVPAEHQYCLPTHSWSRPGSKEGEVRVLLPPTYLVAWRLCATTCAAAHDGALAQRFLIVSLWRVLFSPR